MKILFLIILAIGFVNLAYAVETRPSNPGQCGDGVCDSAEQVDNNLCPQDCQGNSATPTSTATVSATSEIKIDSFKYEVRNSALVFFIDTLSPDVSALSVTDANGQVIKDLKIFSNSEISDINSYSGQKPTTYSQHAYFISNLLANSQYLVKVIFAAGPDNYPEVLFNARTSSSKNQTGTMSLKNQNSSNYDEYAKTVGLYSSNNWTKLDDVAQTCKDNNFDKTICSGISALAGAITTQDEKNLANVQTLADKFFNNKIVFYGDIGLLALLLLLELVYLLKSRGSWGVVFDSKDKKPLQGAIVRVFLEESNKMLETKVTDAEGRYSFLVKPGNFYLDVTKADYRFPSKFITKREDEFYGEMYRGEVLHIFKSNAVLNPNIPIDKVGETLESMEESHKALSSFGKKFKYFMISKLRLILLVLVTILNVGFVIIAYVPPLMVIAILVGFMWLLEGYAILKKGHY